MCIRDSIYRAGEDPVEAIAAVISRVKHVHIRDCKGRQQGPGKPEDQANGRGDIDLVGYVRVLHANGYAGPLDLEIIGAREYAVEQCCIIAAESRGHMQACLQACAARWKMGRQGTVTAPNVAAEHKHNLENGNFRRLPIVSLAIAMIQSSRE